MATSIKSLRKNGLEIRRNSVTNIRPHGGSDIDKSTLDNVEQHFETYLIALNFTDGTSLKNIHAWAPNLECIHAVFATANSILFLSNIMHNEH